MILSDRSLGNRLGLKGRHAAGFLETSGIPVPDRPNTYRSGQGLLVLRLGVSEFLLEGRHPALTRIGAVAPGLHPFPREDCSLFMAGTGTGDLLRQTCSLDFGSWDPESRSLALTVLAGIGVTLLKGAFQGLPCYLLWCDYSHGPYLWKTISSLAMETGGYVTVPSGSAGLPDGKGIFPAEES